jgi:hypothetical protein
MNIVAQIKICRNLKKSNSEVATILILNVGNYLDKNKNVINEFYSWNFINWNNYKLYA